MSTQIGKEEHQQQQQQQGNQAKRQINVHIFFYYFVVFIKNCFYKYYRFFLQRLILFEFFFIWVQCFFTKNKQKQLYISLPLESSLSIYINCGTNTPIFCLIRAFFPSVQITQSSLDGLPSMLLLLLFIYLFKLFLFVKYLIAFGGKSSKKNFCFWSFCCHFHF